MATNGENDEFGKLHSILSQGKMELSANEAAIANISATLANTMNQPGNTEFAKLFNDSLGDFSTQMDGSFSAGWAVGSKRVLGEAGIHPYLGDQLHTSIKKILSEHSFAPTLARAKMDELRNQIVVAKGAVDRILQGCQILGITGSSDFLQECEASFLFPVQFIGGRLDKFAAEVKEIDTILGNLSEISTGDRKGGYKIQTISSSDFLIHVVIPTATVALLIVKFVGALVDIYVKLQGVKKTTQETEIAKQFSKKVVAEMRKEFSEIKEREIEQAVNALAKSTKGRANELKNEMRRIIKTQLHKMDNGVEISILLPRPIIKRKDNSSGDKKVGEKAGSSVIQPRRTDETEMRERLAKMHRVKIDENARLELPAPSESDSDDADSD